MSDYTNKRQEWRLPVAADDGVYRGKVAILDLPIPVDQEDLRYLLAYLHLWKCALAGRPAPTWVDEAEAAAFAEEIPAAPGETDA